MKTLFEHIDHVREQPHHVRRQVAKTTAFGLTALIAVVWFGTLVSMGTFNIQGSSFAEGTSPQPVVVAAGPQDNANLLGAASAAASGQSAPAHIEIISTATSSTLTGKQMQAEQTVIPF